MQDGTDPSLWLEHYNKMVALLSLFHSLIVDKYCCKRNANWTKADDSFVLRIKGGIHTLDIFSDHSMERNTKEIDSSATPPEDRY